MDYKYLKIHNHVAMIIDGNGRWAKEKGLSRSKGHDAGVKTLKKLGKYILSKGIKVLSVYVFSTENFKRDEREVKHLMNLCALMFKKDKNFFIENNIKVVFSGRDEPLPKKVIDARDELVELTKNNTGGIFNICLNYGGRAEIVDATKKIIKDGLNVDEVDEKLFSKYLYQDLGDVDFLIRTSGELRISNFLLWELSYAELYFSDKYFPDFNEVDFDKAILDYTKRDRRFGGIKK
ncbi:MAG: polyprenyl diphosphate synthase [Bacilli bacterium]|nr:polyprenyl diphosphate synthase [Bacilli bacterium]